MTGSAVLAVLALFAFVAWAPGAWLTASVPYFAVAFLVFLAGLGWLAWTLRDGDDGHGGDQPEVILPDGPGGLEVDWDAELAQLLERVPSPCRPAPQSDRHRNL